MDSLPHFLMRNRNRNLSVAPDDQPGATTGFARFGRQLVVVDRFEACGDSSSSNKKPAADNPGADEKSTPSNRCNPPAHRPSPFASEEGAVFKLANTSLTATRIAS